MTKYHEAAHTLDPDKELPDDEELAPSAGHDEEMTEKVIEAHNEFREAVQAEREEQAKRDQEWAERDPKPKPSELLAERGHEPAREDEDNGRKRKSESKSEGKSEGKSEKKS